MKKMLLPLLLIAFSAVQAQQETGKISGTVKDESGKSVESASVSVLKALDSSVVKQSVSDKTGGFNVQGIQFGKYLVSISLVGHKTYFSAVLQLESSKAKIAFRTTIAY